MSRPPGLPRTGGRKKGTLDKARRFQLTERMARDILATYRKLGGQEFLLKFAQENPKEFVQQCLGRLMPAPYKEDPDLQVNTQVNLGNLSDFEVAQRIAFTLNKGVHAQEQAVLSPQESCRIEQAPEPVPEPIEPEPVERPKSFRDEAHYAEWCEQAKMTPEQKALIHRPSAEEQGLVSTPGSNGIKVVRRKR